jgi:hypothetical protein
MFGSIRGGLRCGTRGVERHAVVAEGRGERINVSAKTNQIVVDDRELARTDQGPSTVELVIRVHWLINMALPALSNPTRLYSAIRPASAAV